MLELYNKTGTRITAFHYDPVFLTSEYDPTDRSSFDLKSMENTHPATGPRDLVAAAPRAPAHSQSAQPKVLPPRPRHVAPGNSRFSETLSKKSDLASADVKTSKARKIPNSS